MHACECVRIVGNHKKCSKIILHSYVSVTWASCAHDEKSMFLIILEHFLLFLTMRTHAQACLLSVEIHNSGSWKFVHLKSELIWKLNKPGVQIFTGSLSHMTCLGTSLGFFNYINKHTFFICLGVETTKQGYITVVDIKRQWNMVGPRIKICGRSNLLILQTSI